MEWKSLLRRMVKNAGLFRHFRKRQATSQHWVCDSHCLRDSDPLRSLLHSVLGEGHSKDAILHGRLDFFGLSTRRQRESPGELTIPPLAHGVSVFLVLRRGLRLARNGQAIVVNIDLNVLLPETRELEGRCDLVIFGRLVDVHVRPERSSDITSAASTRHLVLRGGTL